MSDLKDLDKLIEQILDERFSIPSHDDQKWKGENFEAKIYPSDLFR